VLELQGVNKSTIRDYSKNCAPCHLPNLDPTIITSTWIPPLDYPCQVCQRTNDADQMLLCDNYNGGYHIFYFKPKLIQVPIGIWYYSSCSPVAPWFLLKPCHDFPGLGPWGGDTWEFHLSLLLCIVYICASIFFWLISFYLWLVLVFVTTPFWGNCEVATHTPENGTWESSETPKNSECDCKGQNTFHWGVLYILGKVLKCRCPKWPRMNHLDIYSTSYGRKKGWESN